MYLIDVFDQLTNGEFSDVAIGGNEAGFIDPANYNRIVPHVNVGLNALYKRFRIKTGGFTLELQPDRLIYPIASKYAVSSLKSREIVRYIKDSTADPFKDDVIKIDRVVAESGYEFHIDDLEDPYTMRLPTYTTLSVPNSIVNPSDTLEIMLKTKTLAIEYRAKHPLILMDGADLEPEEIKLELPDEYMECLLYFIACRYLAPSGVYNGTNPANDYYAKYENACLLIENKGLQGNDQSQPDKIQRNGWV